MPKRSKRIWRRSSHRRFAQITDVEGRGQPGHLYRVVQRRHQENRENGDDFLLRRPLRGHGQHRLEIEAKLVGACKSLPDNLFRTSPSP